MEQATPRINLEDKPGIQKLIDSPVWSDRSKSTSQCWQPPKAAPHDKELNPAGKAALVEAMPKIKDEVLLSRAVYGQNAPEHQERITRVLKQELEKLKPYDKPENPVDLKVLSKPEVESLLENFKILEAEAKSVKSPALEKLVREMNQSTTLTHCGKKRKLYLSKLQQTWKLKKQPK
jgi:hypothetical protein